MLPTRSDRTRTLPRKWRGTEESSHHTRTLTRPFAKEAVVVSPLSAPFVVAGAGVDGVGEPPPPCPRSSACANVAALPPEPTSTEKPDKRSSLRLNASCSTCCWLV